MFYLGNAQIFDQMKNALSLACMFLAGILLSTSSFAQSNTLFNPDYNGDGFIGVDDILGALSFYDNAWDGPVSVVASGCTYESYLEYDASAVADDGSCATLIVFGCTDSEYFEYNPLANMDDGSCITTIHACGDPFSYHGYDYQTVLIGDQCWFKDNLRTTMYSNGDVILADLNGGEWSNTEGNGATAVYGEFFGPSWTHGGDCYYNVNTDGDACNPSWSLNEYGRLYNWYAVEDARGLCPSGWHVPTEGEFIVLIDHLGGNSVAGAALKTTYGWHDPGWGGNGTNSSGFSGLPSGYRTPAGDYSIAGRAGWWWSSTMVGNEANSMSVGHDSPSSNQPNFNLVAGLAIRCIQDAE